jgi:hypothetical protein
MTWIAVHVQPPLWNDLHSYEIRWTVTAAKPNSPGGYRSKWCSRRLRIRIIGYERIENDADCGFCRLTTLPAQVSPYERVARPAWQLRGGLPNPRYGGRGGEMGASDRAYVRPTWQ